MRPYGPGNVKRLPSEILPVGPKWEYTGAVLQHEMKGVWLPESIYRLIVVLRLLIAGKGSVPFQTSLNESKDGIDWVHLGFVTRGSCSGKRLASIGFLPDGQIRQVKYDTPTFGEISIDAITGCKKLLAEAVAVHESVIDTWGGSRSPEIEISLRWCGFKGIRVMIKGGPAGSIEVINLEVIS